MTRAVWCRIPECQLAPQRTRAGTRLFCEDHWGAVRAWAVPALRAAIETATPAAETHRVLRMIVRDCLERRHEGFVTALARGAKGAAYGT